MSRALASERARVASESLRAQLDRLDAPPPPPVLITRPTPPARRILEGPFQGLILDIAGHLKWEHFHVLDSRGSDPGWPDLVLARRTGLHEARIIFRELKTESGRVSRAQAHWGRLLLAAGFDWAIWRPSDWDAILDTLTTV